MRSLVLVGLAACWSSTSPSPPATKPPAQPPQAAPPIATSSSAKPPQAAPAIVVAAPIAKRAPYRLPKRVTDALATEPLAGNVLVPHGVSLHPTEAAARADADPRTKGVPFAVRVIRDRGEVLEVETAPVADCAGDFDQPYELTVFVKREKLWPRTKVEVTKTFADGTAVAIDRGAPVEISETGLAWEVAGLAQSKVAPSEDQLTYAVPASLPPAALTKSTGDRLVCDSTPMTLDEWRAARRRAREAALRAEADKRRAEMEARRAELERQRAERERQRAERERQRKAEAKKKPAAKSNAKTLDDMVRMADQLTDLGAYDSELGVGRYSGIGFDRYDDDERFAPWCGVSDPASYSFSSTPPKTALPTVNGNPVSWPYYAERTSNDHVVRSGAKYLADIDYRCGRVRMSVERDGVHAIGGAGAIGGGGQIQVWVPKPGKVTWADGTPAGRYTGHKKYRDVVEQPDRICVRVYGVAELVCHDKKTTKTEMAYRYGLD